MRLRVVDSGRRWGMRGYDGMGIGPGVLWAVWAKYGFWWGLWYGFFWVPWLGYRVAEWMLR